MKPLLKQLLHRENVTFVCLCKFAYLILKGDRERKRWSSQNVALRDILKVSSFLLSIRLM